MSEDYSQPSKNGFVALYADYLSLRALASKGRTNRAELVSLAKRLSESLLQDAEALPIAEFSSSPSMHCTAWTGQQHPLERPPRYDVQGPEQGRLMVMFKRQWKNDHSRK